MASIVGGVITASDEPGSSLDDAHEIAGLLFAVAERTRHVFEAAARRVELTPPQARALLELDRPASMRAIAQRLRCDASNVTGIADRLQARGLIRRDEGRQDRRIKTLTLTPAGERARVELEAAVRSSPAMAGLSDAERATLRELLAKVVPSGVTP